MFNHSRNRSLAIAVTLLSLMVVPRADAMIVIAVELPDLILDSNTIVQGVVQHLDNVVLDRDGKVVSRDQLKSMTGGLKDMGLRAFTDVSIYVGKSYKGQGEPGKVLKLRLVGGRIGEYTLAVPGMPRFQPQEEVFLFLEKTNQGLVPIGAAQGVFRVERTDDSPAIVRHDLQGVAILRPAELPEHCGGVLDPAKNCTRKMTSGLPGIPDRMPLATLRDHVLAVLGVPTVENDDKLQKPKLIQLP